MTARPLRRLADAPLAQAVALGAGWTGVTGYVRALRDPEGVDADRLLASLVVGALVTAVAAVVLVLRRRRPSPAPRWREVSEALDDARLPDDADSSAWSLILLRRRELIAGLGGGWMLAVTGALLAGTVAVSLTGGPVLAWTLPAVAACVVVVVRCVRDGELVRIDAVLQPLLRTEDERERERPRRPRA